MIDNFEQIKKLLQFNNINDFYFLQIIQRKKDHKDSPYKLSCNNNNRLIKAYYIYDIEQLDKYKLEIIELCKLFNARAGISLNKRNSKVLSFEMMKLLAQNISCDHYNQLGNIWNTVCGQYHQDKDKTWILDVDTKEKKFIDLIEDTIEQFDPKGLKVVTQIETKNGFHLIVKPFNTSKFGELFPEVEIHKNNPTILYIP